MNYKIEVNSEAESKEARGYFEDLGAVCCSGLERNKNVNFLFMNSGFVTACKLQENFDKSKCKEITLPELRALASLHKNLINMDKVLSRVRSDALGLLKDKEYLRKNSNGTYSYVGVVHPDHVHDLMIEIPEGAESFNYFGSEGNVFFLKNDGEKILYSNETEDWSWQDWGDIDFDGVVCLWQRAKKPEELPFVDDEPSINDQYAEIKQVRKEYKLKNDMSVDDYINSLRCEDTINHPPHNHYFIDVSDVDEVDFYEIALRYNVTDPCIQHILKKCLAVGNRGHKDFHTDLKDIYDTAARALRIHGG